MIGRPKFAPIQIVIFAALVLIGVFVGVRGLLHKNGRMGLVIDSANNQKTYLALDAFVSSTMEQVPTQLADAFAQGTLFEAGSWDIPGPDGKRLVVATPTLSGHQEKVGCGDTHPLCGLYVVNKDGSATLLVWGDTLRGFGGVHGFLNVGNPVIWSAWSMLSYTLAQEGVLDLTTGKITPIIVMETDDNGPSAELIVTRPGQKKVLVKVTGTVVDGKKVPTEISVHVDEKQTTTVSKDLIGRLADFAKTQDAEKLSAIETSEASFPTQQSDIVTLSLYGKAFQLDATRGTLEPVSEF